MLKPRWSQSACRNRLVSRASRRGVLLVQAVAAVHRPGPGAVDDVVGDEPVLADEALPAAEAEVVGLGLLVDEHQHAGGDQRDREDRGTPGRVDVLERDHGRGAIRSHGEHVGEERRLGVHAVLGLVPDRRARPVEDLVGDLLARGARGGSGARPRRGAARSISASSMPVRLEVARSAGLRASSSPIETHVSV